MALSSALVDRARSITYEALMRHMPDGSLVPVRVEGESKFEWVYGQWFDCRIDSPAAAETTDAAGGRSRASQKPQLMFDVEDDDGNPVELHDTNRVEIESEDFGTHTWRLMGEPTLYRKKRGLVIGEVDIERLLDAPVTDGRVIQLADVGAQPVHVIPSGS